MSLTKQIELLRVKFPKHVFVISFGRFLDIPARIRHLCVVFSTYTFAIPKYYLEIIIL